MPAVNASVLASLFADDLENELTASSLGVELEQRDLLPRAEQQLAVLERDGNGGPEQCSSNVARAIVVTPPQMMPIRPGARCKRLKDFVQIAHCARLKLDRCHARCRSNDEYSDNSVAETRFRHSPCDWDSDVMSITLTGRGDLVPERCNHATGRLKSTTASQTVHPAVAQRENSAQEVRSGSIVS